MIRGRSVMVLMSMLLLGSMKAKAISAEDLALHADGERRYGTVSAKVVTFGGYSTPECRLAISMDGQYFFFKKMHSTCWKGTNTRGVKIVCNSDRSVCKTREELKQFVSHASQKNQNAVVQGLESTGDDFLAVRDRPEGKLLGKLYDGDRVVLLERSGKWYHIKRVSDGLRGWSYYKWLKPLREGEGETASQPRDSETVVLTPKRNIQYAYTDYLAHHILLPTEEKAWRVLKKLQEAPDKKAAFARLARNHSTSPTASKGGALGWASKGQYIKPFEEALRSLQSGEILNEPVKTQFGWHIIYLERGALDDAPDWCDSRGLTPTEQTLCTKASLVALEKRLNTLYQQQRISSDKRWMFRRQLERCGRSESCIREAYKEKLAAIDPHKENDQKRSADTPDDPLPKKWTAEEKQNKKICLDEIANDEPNRARADEACLATAEAYTQRRMYNHATWFYLLAGAWERLFALEEKTSSASASMNIAHARVLNGDLEKVDYRKFLKGIAAQTANSTMAQDYAVLKKFFPNKTAELQRGWKIWREQFAPLQEVETLYKKYKKARKEKDHVKAFTYSNQIFKIEQNSGLQDEAALAPTRFLIAREESLLGRYHESIRNFQILEAYHRKINALEELVSDYSWIAYGYKELERYHDAIAYYKRYLRIKEKIAPQERAIIQERYETLTDLLDRVEQYSEAKTYCKKNLQLSEALKGEYHTDTIKIYTRCLDLEIMHARHLLPEKYYQENLKKVIEDPNNLHTLPTAYRTNPALILDAYAILDRQSSKLGMEIAFPSL